MTNLRLISGVYHDVVVSNNHETPFPVAHYIGHLTGQQMSYLMNDAIALLSATTAAGVSEPLRLESLVDDMARHLATARVLRLKNHSMIEETDNSVIVRSPNGVLHNRLYVAVRGNIVAGYAQPDTYWENLNRGFMSHELTQMLKAWVRIITDMTDTLIEGGVC